MRALLPVLAACAVISSVPMNVSAEDLRCSKVKDPQAKTKYVADVLGITAEAGCTIKVPATMVCVPATTTDIVPAPPGPSSNSTSKGLACYQMKCPKKKGQKTLPNVRVDDQFGDRSVTPKPSNLLCVPVDTPIFSCGTSPFPQCGGTCPGDQVCVDYLTADDSGGVCAGTEQCRCADPEVACNGAPCPSRICRDIACPFQTVVCDSCKRPGGSCTTNAQCCFGKCETGIGGLGTCVDDERSRDAAAP